MKRLLLLSIVVLMLSVSAYAVSVNWATNGDFENGLTGWTGGAFSTPYMTAQLVSAANGAKLSTYDNGIGTTPAPAVTPFSGTSVGWTRSGAGTSYSAPDHVCYSYVSQTVNVAAGTYTISEASWKALAGNTTQRSSCAAMFLMRVDDQIGTLYKYTSAADAYTFRSTKWDYQLPAHNWASKSVAAGSTFTTTTGNVQFILAFQDMEVNSDDKYYPNEDCYSYAAFDNFVFKTVQDANPILVVDTVPEPSGLLALFSGAAGLAGFVIRRRK